MSYFSTTFFYDGIRTFERMTNLRKDQNKDAIQVKIFYHNPFLGNIHHIATE